jgi:hypothetical protein
MSLVPKQQEQLEKLLEHRDSIVSHLYQIEHILKEYFPEQFELAYQHWIPQISTALYEQNKWLPRGQYSMQNTLDVIKDSDTGSGVYKYLR